MGGAWSTARLDVELEAQDLAGLHLDLSPGETLRGRVEAEGMGSFEGISIFLRANPERVESSGRVLPNGDFAIPHVSHDVHRLFVSRVPSGFFVRSIRVGDAEIGSAAGGCRLDCTAGIPGDLIIALARGTAQLTGRVVDQIHEVPVMLLDESSEIVRRVITKDDGSYTISEIAPGRYRLVAADLDRSDPIEAVALRAQTIVLTVDEARQIDLRLR